MSIQLKHLFVYTQAAPTSLSHFVEFWAKRYYYPNDHWYTQNINGPHTPNSLGELFKWKTTARLFATQHSRLRAPFIDRYDEAKELLRAR